jgi:hypothetical protein
VILRDRLAVSPALWTAVGVPELLAAVGLCVGIWWSGIGVAAAAGTVLLMLSAAALHLRVRFLGKALVPPLAVAALAVATAAVRAAAA